MLKRCPNRLSPYNAGDSESGRVTRWRCLPHEGRFMLPRRRFWSSSSLQPPLAFQCGRSDGAEAVLSPGVPDAQPKQFDDAQAARS